MTYYGKIYETRNKKKSRGEKEKEIIELCVNERKRDVERKVKICIKVKNGQKTREKTRMKIHVLLFYRNNFGNDNIILIGGESV